MAVITFDSQFLFARLKIGDLRQHHIEKSARFTRLHHGDINAGKGLRRFAIASASDMPSMTSHKFLSTWRSRREWKLPCKGSPARG